MAIQFARCQYVSRSTGGNACRKASYNQRGVVPCDRTGEVFSFKNRDGNAYHEVMLPIGTDTRFKDASFLWNAVEKFERRKDSQVAKEFVIALPDDKGINIDDRIELSRRFIEKNFISKGVAVQLDIHEPHEGEHNWHAHLLVTTRRFSEDGLTFSKYKAKDLDPIVRRGHVLEGDHWGEIWRDVQNEYFEEKGLSLRVDPIGIIPQEHIGPVRMRHHMNEALQRAELLKEANEILAKNPESILDIITKHTSVFSERDIDAFIAKHIPENERLGLKGSVLEHSRILKLYDPTTKKETGLFTLKEIRSEEEKLLRFADKIANNKHKALDREAINNSHNLLSQKKLSREQKLVFDLCVSGNNLTIIQGRAGVGKSTVLNPIREAHARSGYRVIGLAPTHKVAQDMIASGFYEAKTCHAFLFALKNNREHIDRKTTLIVDEAAMLSNELMVEIFHIVKKSGSKLIMVGDERQLSSIERGGMFGILAERYGSIEISQVRRQQIDWQKQVSEDLSKGYTKEAVKLLETNKAINFQETKEDTLSALLHQWGQDTATRPHSSRLILAQKNSDVDALNLGARDILRQQGKLGDMDYDIMTRRGLMPFAEGDRVHFTKIDKEQGIINGMFGTIKHINPDSKLFQIALDNKETVMVNPHHYEGLRHGYASTVYKAQGATLDHTYIQHSKITNNRINYVALTRQTQSVSLFVNQQETRTTTDLIKQMERKDRKESSLNYLTLKDIEKEKNLEKSDNSQEGMSFLKHKVKTHLEDMTIRIKDTFHTNKDFYDYQKKAAHHKHQQSQHPIKASSPLFFTGKDYNECIALCERRLLTLFRNNEGRPADRVELNKLNLQAEKTAEFIYHLHTLKGNHPTLDDVKLYSSRTRYEMERMPEIHSKLIKEWKAEGGYEKTDTITAHLIAERLSTIEGRILLEREQQGQEPPHDIHQLAIKEFETNNEKHISDLTKEFTNSFSLTQKSAQRLANEVIRYQEKYGTKPSHQQLKQLTQIVTHFEDRDQIYVHHHKNLDDNQINFLRRREIDYLIKHYAATNKNPYSKEFQAIEHKVLNELNKMSKNLYMDIQKGFSR